jgi:uncharacterized repeat protein (TIGR01451 family)
MKLFDQTIGLRGLAKDLISGLFTLIFLASLLSPAHANDNFPGTTITGNSGSLNASNTAATGQTGEPLTYNGGSLNTMWYSWTAPSNGTLTVQTCGGTSNFDTTLQTFTGTAVNGLTQVATNDDSCGTQSVNTVTVTSGTIYRIQVDGYGSDTGNFTLFWSFASATNNADLSLSKSVSNATPALAETISYTLTLTNASGSPSTASGITVQDTLPAGVTFVSATGTGSYSNGTGVWTVGSLAPGGVATLNIVVTVSAASGTVTNIAEVTASSVPDIDSTPNNGVTTEDDFASRAFTVSARIAGTPPTLTCPAGTTTFDWDGRTWTAGTLSNNYALTNVGTFGINISTSTPFVAGSPALNGNLTGGLSPVQNSLFLNMNNLALSDVSTTVIALPTAVPGMQFRLFDVDFGAGSYADKVTVTGSFNGSAVTPTLTNGVSNYVTGNVAIGDTGSTDTAATGNVVVTFLTAVDTITVVYGNHSTAPANPGNQWMSVHDISFCNPVTNLSVTKTSSVVSDGVSVTNPKALPSALVRYCILISNAGSATANNVSVSDAIPATVTYVPGTLLSGTSCATATTAEDDNNSGADESDPNGASISGATITASSTSLTTGSSLAFVFNANVN